MSVNNLGDKRLGSLGTDIFEGKDIFLKGEISTPQALWVTNQARGCGKLSYT